MGRRIGDLVTSDFPGIDEAKFNEWKALKIKKNRERRMALYIGIGILLILSVLSVVTAKPLFLLAFLIFLFDDLIVPYRRRYRRLRQLEEELKMSARLRAMKGGRSFSA
jgi:Flp pilus assembly protein TadB